MGSCFTLMLRLWGCSVHAVLVALGIQGVWCFRVVDLGLQNWVLESLCNFATKYRKTLLHLFKPLMGSCVRARSASWGTSIESG